MTQRIRRRVQRPPGATTATGYGAAHQRARKAALAALRDGDPCSRCGGPLYRGQKLHLDHDDIDRSQYRGLAHAYCNVAASNRSPRRQLVMAWRASRLW
jgi:hypothetical protein